MSYPVSAHYDHKGQVKIEMARCAPCGEYYPLGADDSQPCPYCQSKDRIYAGSLTIPVTEIFSK